MGRNKLRLILALTIPLLLVGLPALGSPDPAAVSRNVTLLSHLNAYGRYSACCRYVHADGREYAVLGTDTGTSIVNITDPSAPYEVAFIPGLASSWREMKQYGSHLYIATEAYGAGLQIVSMSDPEHPELVRTYSGSFNRAHTVAVDTARALLILNGTRLDNVPAGLRILSLAVPENPVEVASYLGDYVHDSWTRNDTLYASCIASGTMRVFDIRNPGSPTEIASWTYPGAHTHSAETSRDGRFLYVCDEVNYGTMKVFDIRDLATHPMLGEICVNPLAIVHNVHVKADTALVAYYTEGVRLFDLSDPSLPAEWGHYDTYGGFSGNYHGVWDVASFPSGTFIASDIESGLYVFRATPNYGTVTVRVRDAASRPLRGVDVTVSGAPDSARTQALGAVRLALAPGVYTLRVAKFGYATAEVPATVALGGHSTVEVALPDAPTGTIRGTVRRSGDRAGLPDATIEDESRPALSVAGVGGAYALPSLPAGTYRLLCDRAGCRPEERVVTLVPGEDRVENWSLRPASWYDSCDADRGWSLSAPGDDATAGTWVRTLPAASPSAAAPRPGLRAPQSPDHVEPAEGETGISAPVRPEDDATPGSGLCFVTGSPTPGGSDSQADVDGGRTTLTSPRLDVSGLIDPVFAFRCWYFMNTPGDPDSFLVELSGDDGAWVPARTLLASRPEWHLETIRVRDLIPSASGVRVRFIAQDEGVPGIVIAAIDDVELYDAAIPTDDAWSPAPSVSAAVRLDTPSPNPAPGPVTVSLELPRAGEARVRVFDLRGRLVATLHDGPAPAGRLPLVWDGRDREGRAAASGVYWVRVDAEGAVASRRVVRAR